MTKALDMIVWDWGVRCFGSEHMHDKRIRTLRMVEEAIEAAQAQDVLPETVHALIDYVYGRERGRIAQELGGIFITLRMLCLAHDLEPEKVYLDEIIRCLSKDPEYFAARNREKMMIFDE